MLNTTEASLRVRQGRALATILAACLLAACHSSMPKRTDEAAAAPASRAALLLPSTQIVNRPYTGTLADWPLFFTRANWGYACYNAQACMITLGTWEMKVEDLKPRRIIDSATVPGYPDHTLTGGMVGMVPFEEQHAYPARVLWRTKDGTVLRASIDILDIFKDRLIRHETPREDVSPISSIGFTEIILEVNDRTINVYTRTLIPRGLHVKTSNPPRYSNDKLIKVFSQTY